MENTNAKRIQKQCIDDLPTAKKILVIVGSKKAVGLAVGNVTVSKRNTLLKERLGKGHNLN